MAPIRLRRTSARRLSAASIAVFMTVSTSALALSAAPAQARDIKQQIASAQQRLRALNDRAEAASERYNAARIRLGDAQQKADSAQRELTQAERSLDGMRASVSAFASAAYQGQTLNNTFAMTASSPEAYLDQVSTMQAVATSQQDALAKLAAAEHAESVARANASAALAEQRRETAEMKAERAQVLDAAHQAEQLLSKLRERQQEIIAAAKARAERIAAQQAAAALRAQQQAARQAAAALAAQPPTPPAVNPAPSGSGGAATAVKWAYAELGKPYVWGAAGPDSFDCSGLTQYVWGKAGVYLDHYTGSQWNEGMHVTRDQLQPGDLIFFGSDLHHVAIWIGNNQFIHAPHTGTVVQIESLTGYYSDEYAGAVRPGV